MLLLCILAAACPRSKGTSPPAPTPDAAMPAQVSLVFSANVEGWVEPCGCTTEPLGGIHRIRGELQKMKAHGPVLFFDAGNLLFERQQIPPAARCQESARVNLLLESLRGSGLALTALGSKDMSLGDGWRTQALTGHDLWAVSANVSGAQRVVGRRMLEAGGVKVGFTGVTWPADAPWPTTDNVSVPWHGLQLAHPVKSVAREAGLLRQEGAHVVVVLGQTSRAHLQRLASQVNGLDLIVAGVDPGETPVAPQEVARGTYLVAAGQQGQYLGRLLLTLPDVKQSCCLAYDDGGKGARAEAEQLRKRAAQMVAQAEAFAARKDTANAQFRHKKAQELLQRAKQAEASAAAGATVEGNRFAFDPLPLGRSVAADRSEQARLTAYKDALAGINAACEKDVACPPAPAGKAHYVGTRRCMDCHQEAYDFWKQATVVDPARAAQYAAIPNHPNKEGRLGHVRAFQTLEEAKATGNRDCIKCHTVGFEEPGGFCKVADGPAWAAVGCENCHGPGSTHARSEEVRDIAGRVPEETCRECHHVPHILSRDAFVYKEKLRAILGPGHGEARLRALTGSP